MATIDLTNDQLIEFIRQLPSERKREALWALAKDADARRAKRMAFAEQQLRRIAVERGLDWDAMSEEDRQALADDLIHEDRACDK
jgi:hypothetical protein